MKSKTPGFDKAFVERQRERLTKLRAQLEDATQATKDEEAGINAELAGEALESEDDAQRLAILDVDEDLIARNAQRLARIKRALEKIDEGTYGLSDASGDPIPRERLEATPEAIFTVAEQESSEE